MSRFVLLLAATIAFAHPMGNFSVSHYTRLHVTPAGVDITYALDLAEVPAYEMLKSWQVDPNSPQSTLDAHATRQAQSWLENLEFRSANQPVTPALQHADIKIANAGGGLFTARVESMLHLNPSSADLQFEDKNFADRPGRKEIVIDASPGIAILTASQPGTPPRDIPNDLRAAVTWRAAPAAVATKIIPIPQPAPIAIESTNPTPEPRKTDRLTSILSRRDLSFGVILIGLAIAFAFGAMHALSPGHGKTIVAAYLVGSRGTMRHAAFLGAMVTFTHTLSVFALGLATLFLSKYFVPERMAKTLETISGLSIVAIGAWLLYKRVKSLRPHHHHHHDHDHHHHPHTHTHVPEGDVTLGSLIALGASGGLVPCPSAMVLLLFAISVGRIGLGLLLLVAFSIGLAGVLTAIGMLVLYAKHWLPDPASTSRHPMFRFLPVASAAVIVCIGLVMTGVSIK
jgi:nickel/cobalt transporter (NicO) family protein